MLLWGRPIWLRGVCVCVAVAGPSWLPYLLAALLVHYLLPSVCDSLSTPHFSSLSSPPFYLSLSSVQSSPVQFSPSPPPFTLSSVQYRPPAHLGYLACSLSFRHLDLIHIHTHIHTPTTPTHPPHLLAACSVTFHLFARSSAVHYL